MHALRASEGGSPLECGNYSEQRVLLESKLPVQTSACKKDIDWGKFSKFIKIDLNSLMYKFVCMGLSFFYMVSWEVALSLG